MSLLPWNATQLVNTVTASSQSYPEITQLNDGTMVVTWVDTSSGNSDIKFQRYDAVGNKIGVETMAHGASASDQFRCDISALTDGGFVITYVDGNTVVGQKFTAAGVPVGGVSIMGGPTFFEGGFFAPPAVQALAGGAYAVVYTTQNFASTTSGIDLVGRIVNAAGVPGAAFNIASFPTGEQVRPAVALSSSGELLVTWRSDHSGTADVFMRRFSSSGVAQQPNEILVNAITNGGQGFQSITKLSNGFFVVTFFSDDPATTIGGGDVRGQIVNFNANKVGAEFLAGTTQFGYETFSTVVALADGKFMVLYEDRAQMFNSNGTTLGGELLISARIFDRPHSAVTLADGRVALTWTSTAIDGSGTGIGMQILDPREGVFNGTTDADTLYGNDAGDDWFHGDAGTDSIYGLRGNDTLFGDEGNDSLHGGRGDDTLYGGAEQDSLIGGVGADDLDGGDGVDTANYALAAFAVTASLDGTLLGTNEALDDTYVSIENLTGTNLAAQGDTLRGNAVANSIAGLAGADFLNGVGGHDRLTGGAGIDTLTGGIGNDSFIYNTLTEGGDIITDFSSFAANNNDVFRFKGTVFGGLAAGAITAAQFQSSTSNVAATGTVDFFYETDTRILRFDADGSGAGAAVTIATLQVGATMAVSDILIF